MRPDDLIDAVADAILTSPDLIGQVHRLRQWGDLPLHLLLSAVFGFWEKFGEPDHVQGLVDAIGLHHATYGETGPIQVDFKTGYSEARS